MESEKIESINFSIWDFILSEMGGLSEGYKQAIDQNWGCMAKIGFLGQKPKFWAKKKALTFVP